MKNSYGIYKPLRLAAALSLCLGLLCLPSFLAFAGETTKTGIPLPLTHSQDIMPSMTAAPELDAAGENLSISLTGDSQFLSHLPVVVIEAAIDAGFEDGSWQEWNAEISIYDGNETNSPAEAPVFRGKASFLRQGEILSKAGYKLTFTNEEGEKNSFALLGMREGNEWILDGMMSDKSLLRTHLACSAVAGVVDAPQARYCELLRKDGERYSYEGVYLLRESFETVLTANKELEYIVKYGYDRGAQNDLTSMELLYSNSHGLDADAVHSAANDIAQIEKILYSDEAEVFLSYPDYIHVESFVNYYVLNEFFMNYDDVAYFYKLADGKLRVGSIWNFQNAVDNDIFLTTQPEKVYFHLSPWFERLFKSTEFVEEILARQRELARSVLSADRIESMIDGIVRYLGRAQARDWLRWNGVYASAEYALRDYDPSLKKNNIDGELEPMIMKRQTNTYEQELIRVRYLLREHRMAIGPEIANISLKESKMFHSSDAYTKHSYWAAAFLLLFALSISAAQKFAR